MSRRKKIGQYIAAGGRIIVLKTGEMFKLELWTENYSEFYFHVNDDCRFCYLRDIDIKKTTERFIYD